MVAWRLEAREEQLVWLFPKVKEKIKTPTSTSKVLWISHNVKQCLYHIFSVFNFPFFLHSVEFIFQIKMSKHQIHLVLPFELLFLHSLYISCPPFPLSYFFLFLVTFSLSFLLILSLLPLSTSLPSDAFVLPLKMPIALWPQIDFIGQHPSQ